MIKKENFRYTDSNFYKDTKFEIEPIYHTITDEDIADPGRITLLYGLPYDAWSIVLKYNNIVDPIEDLYPGYILLVPTMRELTLKRLP